MVSNSDVPAAFSLEQKKFGIFHSPSFEGVDSHAFYMYLINGRTRPFDLHCDLALVLYYRSPWVLKHVN